MHLASLMSTQIDLPRTEHLMVTSAALLHDIGHGPFSHAIEGLVSEVLNQAHTDLRDRIIGSPLGDTLEDIGVSSGEVCAMIDGTHRLASIIHGDLDVDRMDYLLRDAHYTGVPYGTVDAIRLIRATRLIKGEVVLHESGVQAAESLLIARTLMRPAVYYHHVSRIAEKLFITAVHEHCRDDPRGILDGMMRMDDAACMQTLLHSENSAARNLAGDLYYRRLYKRALFLRKNDVSIAARTAESSVERERQIAGQIAELCGIQGHQVLVDIPGFPSDMQMQVQVQDRDILLPLEEVSPLITTLNETRKSQWRIGVYTPFPHTATVREAARELLHGRPLTRQERLL
jgi:HD superfamily phosphohydrolase